MIKEDVGVVLCAFLSIQITMQAQFRSHVCTSVMVMIRFMKLGVYEIKCIRPFSAFYAWSITLIEPKKAVVSYPFYYLFLLLKLTFTAIRYSNLQYIYLIFCYHYHNLQE